MKTVDGENLKFKPKAIERISDANIGRDSGRSFFDPVAHFDDEKLRDGSNRLIQSKNDIISKITASSPEGAEAREKLGEALHAIQDFYAHSNHVELGRTGTESKLGDEEVLAEVATPCPSSPGTLDPSLTMLTTGYFVALASCSAPAGKCRHGFVRCTAPTNTGINKDNSGRPGFDDAEPLAVMATKEFVNKILNDPAVTDNAKAVKALMGIRGTLAVVIDDSGSMSGEIGTVQAEVANIVNSVIGTDDEPEDYLLVRYGDPDVGFPIVTGDGNAFLAAVNGLSASGGGDCPELPWTALGRAVAASRKDSEIFLYTDAGALDGQAAPGIIAEAQRKRIGITPLPTGTCSPLDPTYIQAAEETGGQFFLLNPNELSKTFDLVRPQLSGDFVSVFSASGTFAAAETRDFLVPVDSSITNVQFVLRIFSKESISLFRPSGAPVAEGEPGVIITDLRSLLSKLDSGYGNLDSMQAESPQSVPGVGRQKPLKQAFWGNRSLTEGGLRRAA